MQMLESHTLPENYILVTAGGGGDGVNLMEQVLAAREHDPTIDYPVVMVLGPFMKSDSRERIRLRASHLPNITVIDFESRLELMVQHATAIVGMCGYNTFCEAMSFDKKALFVPRTTSREEQYIRAKRASELGLCDLLVPEEAAIPSAMADKLRTLPDIPNPSENLHPEDMAGLEKNMPGSCRDFGKAANDARQKPLLIWWLKTHEAKKRPPDCPGSQRVSAPFRNLHCPGNSGA